MNAEDERLSKVLRVAEEREALRQAYQDNPTKENYVLHAVHVWRQGCVHGEPGNCEECNELFLDKIGKHLRQERGAPI